MTIRPTIWLNDFIVRLNPSPLQPLREPRVTQLINGNFLVSWADSFNLDDTLPGSDVIGQLFDPLGMPIGGRIRINTNFSDNESEADIAALPGGGFLVVYTDDSSTGTAIRWNIRSATGALVSNGTVVSITDAAGRVDNPEIVTRLDGSFAVIWELSQVVALVPTVKSNMQIFDGNGAATSGVLLTGTARSGFDVGVRANGTFVTASALEDLNFFNSEITIRAFTANGTKITTGDLAVITSAVNGVEFFDPQIAGLAATAALPSAARYVVVWTSDSGTNDGIFFSIFDGTQVLVSQRAVTSDSERDNEPAVVALPDGGFFIVWDDDTNGRLEGQRFSATGALVGGQLLLATGGVSEPSLSLTLDGRILVSWNELGQIYSMILDPRLNPITGTPGNDVLTAPTENSTVNGLAGNDRLFGSLFNDTLDGGTGNDTLFGRDGNDRLISGDGNDTMFGGIGNDTMLSGAGNDSYDGGDGIDRVDYQTSAGPVFIDLTVGQGAFGHAQGDRFIRVESLVGSAFNDGIAGDGFANILSGIGGDDTLNGLGGNDDLSGSVGNDTLNGGAGADTLNGGTGLDFASYQGSAAAVVIDLQTGLAGLGDAAGDVFFSIENLRGSSNNDTLRGANGGSTVLGDAGDDTIAGGTGNDVLSGDAGNDTITGGAGFDQLFGGAGNDSLTASASTARAEGGGGNDTLTGNTGNDTLRGDAADDLLNGANGNDTLSGGDGNDRLFGGAGNDRLEAGLGIDTLVGGIGDDRFVVFDTRAVLTEQVTDAGNDVLISDTSFFLAAGQSIETMALLFDFATNRLDLTGNELSQFIRGNSGANILSTGGGAADILEGLAGNDIYRVFNGADQIIETAGQGTLDVVQSAISFTLAADDDVELLETIEAAGIIAINLVGNALAQAITGNAGDNNLNGGRGGDVMTGLGGNDTYRIFSEADVVIEEIGQGTADRVLSGVSYALDKFAEIEVIATLNAPATTAIDLTGNGFGQRIIGNAGANSLTGFGGNDILAGGAGADTFVFFGDYGPTNFARITDYSVADDRFSVDATDSSILPAGALAATAFIANTTGLAQDASDRIIFQSNTGKLFFDADGAGGAAAVQFAQITPNLAITAAEFNIFIAT